MDKREMAREKINSWSQTERETELAKFRKEGYLCNNEEEIITAYVNTYMSAETVFEGIHLVFVLLAAIVGIISLISVFS